MNRANASLFGIGLGVALVLPMSAVAGCGSNDTNGDYQPPALLGGDDSGASPSDATTGDAPTGDGHAAPPIVDSSSPTYDAEPFDAGPCMTTFSYVPAPGTTVQSLSVSGEWNAFASPGVAMTGPDLNGAYSASVSLPPGEVGYKLILNGAWIMDPGAWLRKFVGGVENSEVVVADCHVPTWTVLDSTSTRTAPGAGEYVAHVQLAAGLGEPGLDPSTVTVTLRKDGTTSPLPTPAVASSSGTITLDVKSLADGKYTAFVSGKDRAGNVPAEPLRLVFWVEPEAFDWRDALIYMAMTDRFQDGDPTNNAPALANVTDPLEQYMGGDLQGITARINDGTFDQLGVRSLWLSPFNTNTPNAFLAADNVHYVTGFHGYWPIKAREVDPRFGGDAALHALVTAAHAHGIRVIQDFMVGDIHQEHEYIPLHPDWFLATECVCGTSSSCDWTAQRLSCQFASYLPRVDWTNPAVSDQWQADAVWWVDTFDLDGFRIDAVKQVQDNAITNVSWALRHEFERSGLKFFMTGETAMGWDTCGENEACITTNAQNYDIISEYIGPFGLDGSFDFVSYYAVPSNVFMNDNDGMDQADYWTQASLWEFPQGSIMSPYIGSEDTPRFVSLADSSGGNALAGNQWSNTAGPPTTSDAYGRIQMAMEWLLTTPGAPMMYYGDEYGQYGSTDPNNRMMWRGGGTSLTANELGVQTLVKKLGTARQSLVPLRRGAYVPITATTNDLVFARQTPEGQVAIVGITKSTTATTVTVTLPVTLAVANGTTLHDRLGGPDVSVNGGAVTVSLPPRGAAILAP